MNLTLIPMLLTKALTRNSRGFYFKFIFIIMKKVILEIRASEGGKDSKLLVNDMKNIYIKACQVNNFN